MAELNLKDFPDDLHRELKIRAAEADKTKREFVIAALEAAVATPARQSKK